MFICGEKTSNLTVAYVLSEWMLLSTEVYNMKTGYRDGPSRRVLFWSLFWVENTGGQLLVLLMVQKFGV